LGLKKLPELVKELSNTAKSQGRPVRLMFQDEARFGRINDPSRCWSPPGVRPHVPAQIVREYSYAYAAVSPHDGVLDSLILPVASTEAMSIFLAEVGKRHPDESIIMVIDGAGWHRSNDLDIPPNIQLILLPPRSPQCNPVENLWEEVREKWFPNLVFDSLDALEDRLEEALACLENDPLRVQSVTGFNWIVNIPLNAT
jgi:hypothetical protein